MAKIYTKNSSPRKPRNNEPRKSTVDFLLNYSKALSVIDYKGMALDVILN